MAKFTKLKDPTLEQCLVHHKNGFFLNLINELHENQSDVDAFDFAETDYDALIQDYIDDLSASFDSEFSNKVKLDGGVLHCGWDCEYEFDESSERNRVLSYQISILSFNTTSKSFKLASTVFYPKSDAIEDRYTLEQLVSLIIQFALQKKIIRKWCSYIYLYAHFIRAEFGCLSELFQYKKTIQAISNTYAGHANTYGVDFERLTSQKIKSDLLVLQDKARRKKFSVVKFVDTMLLTPNRGGLSKIGELLGIPKLNILAPYSIEKMSEYLAGDKVGFEAYGIRDAQLALYFGIFMQIFVRHDLGLNYLPMTLAGCGVARFKKVTPNFLHSFGKYLAAPVKRYNSKTGKSLVHASLELYPKRALYEQLATLTFHGGRNESYICGISPVTYFEDLDVKSAYTVAQLGILKPDWDAVFFTQNLDDFKIDTMGFARITFEFPANTLYPSLPIQVGSYGLIFPLKGEAYVTSAEIVVALNGVPILTGMKYTLREF